MTKPPELPISCRDGLKLRPLQAGDQEALLALFGDTSVVRYMDIDLLRDLADADRFLAEILAGYKSGDLLQFGLERDGVVIGTVTLAAVDHNTAKAEVGYAIMPAHAGRGYATLGLQLLCAYAMDKLSLRELYATVDDANPASARVLAKVGFSLAQDTQRSSQTSWTLRCKNQNRL